MGNAAELKDEDFFYALIEDYLNGELSGEDATRMSTLVSEDKYVKIPNEFSIAKGKFQLELAALGMNEAAIHELRILVEGDAERVEHEASKIEKLSRAEMASGLVRRIVFIGALVLLAGIAVKYLSPEEKPAFNPLETLVYEAITMQEDADGRLDYASSSMSETIDFIRSYPDLGFDAFSISEPGRGWILEGGSVIDYEVAKIAVFQFHNAPLEEKIYYFMFQGNLDDLPKTDIGNQRGMIYHTYASERVNVVVWSVEENQKLLGMIVGNLGAQELAEIARVSSR